MARIRTIDDDPSERMGGYGGTVALPPPAPTPVSTPGLQPSFDLPADTPNWGNTNPGQTPPYQFNQGAFNTAFGQATSGKSGTLAEWQNSIFPSLQQQFPDIQSFGSKGDKIRLPNGQTIDAVIAAGHGGEGYGLHYDNGGVGGYFDDPLLQGYIDFGQSAMERLSQPQGVNPVLQQAIDALTRMTSAGAPRMDTSALDAFRGTVQQRQTELNQPGLSTSQQDLLRTNVTDPMEAQRTAARQQVMEHLAARGIQPGSGIMEQALLDVDREFSKMRTTGERELATTEIAQDEARKNQSVDIGGMLAQLGIGAAGTDLQAQVATRGQGVSAAGQLAGIGQGLQDEPIRNLMAALGISGNMAQLPFQANQNAIASMNAINTQPVPQDTGMAQLVQLLLGLSGQGENVYQNEQGNGDSFWGSLGGSLPGLLASFSELFNPSAGNGTGGGVYNGGSYVGE